MMERIVAVPLLLQLAAATAEAKLWTMRKQQLRLRQNDASAMKATRVCAISKIVEIKGRSPIFG